MGALTTADQISEIAFGFMGSKALFAALEHGVFSALADGPLDPAGSGRAQRPRYRACAHAADRADRPRPCRAARRGRLCQFPGGGGVPGQGREIRFRGLPAPAGGPPDVRAAGPNRRGADRRSARGGDSVLCRVVRRPGRGPALFRKPAFGVAGSGAATGQAAGPVGRAPDAGRGRRHRRLRDHAVQGQPGAFGDHRRFSQCGRTGTGLRRQGRPVRPDPLCRGQRAGNRLAGRAGYRADVLPPVGRAGRNPCRPDPRRAGQACPGRSAADPRFRGARGSQRAETGRAVAIAAHRLHAARTLAGRGRACRGAARGGVRGCPSAR